MVESVPMPPEIAAWVAGFVAEHPQSPASFKRQRSKHVSEGKALAEKLDRDDE